MFKSVLTFILLLSFTFISDLHAKNLFDVSGHRFLTGILVQTEDGKKDLVVGKAIISHSWLYKGYDKTVAKIKRVLWAGEIEINNRIVLRVNETSKMIVEDPVITQDLQIPGTGIDNLKQYLSEQEAVRNKYFEYTEYLPYSLQDEHLHKNLKDVSYIRHSVVVNFALITVHLKMATDPKKSNISGKELQLVSISAKEVLEHYDGAITIAPELDTAEWKMIRPYFKKMADKEFDFEYSEFKLAYDQFRCSNVEGIFKDKTLQFSVVDSLMDDDKYSDAKDSLKRYVELPDITNIDDLVFSVFYKIDEELEKNNGRLSSGTMSLLFRDDILSFLEENAKGPKVTGFVKLLKGVSKLSEQKAKGNDHKKYEFDEFRKTLKELVKGKE
ncbi:MAG: hypothetical protein WCQ53_03075 [bacterium]